MVVAANQGSMDICELVILRTVLSLLHNKTLSVVAPLGGANNLIVFVDVCACKDMAKKDRITVKTKPDKALGLWLFRFCPPHYIFLMTIRNLVLDKINSIFM